MSTIYIYREKRPEKAREGGRKSEEGRGGGRDRGRRGVEGEESQKTLSLTLESWHDKKLIDLKEPRK